MSARQILQEDKSNLLIPQEFDQFLKSKETSRKNLSAAFGKKEEKKEKKKKAASATGSSTKGQGNARQPFSSNPYQRGGGNR